MGQFTLRIESDIQKDIQKLLKSGDNATIKRLKNILTELKVHPYIGTGQPKQLKHGLSDFWSRRINKKDRIIYRVDDEKIIVILVSVLGHYGDK